MISLFREKQRWLVTGAAGFIGSNLVEALLGFAPTHHVKEGIEIAMPWYVSFFREKRVGR